MMANWQIVNALWILQRKIMKASMTRRRSNSGQFLTHPHRNQRPFIETWYKSRTFFFPMVATNVHSTQRNTTVRLESLEKKTKKKYITSQRFGTFQCKSSNTVVWIMDFRRPKCLVIRGREALIVSDWASHRFLNDWLHSQSQFRSGNKSNVISAESSKN